MRRGISFSWTEDEVELQLKVHIYNVLPSPLVIELWLIRTNQELLNFRYLKTYGNVVAPIQVKVAGIGEMLHVTWRRRHCVETSQGCKRAFQTFKVEIIPWERRTPFDRPFTCTKSWTTHQRKGTNPKSIRCSIHIMQQRDSWSNPE